MKSKWYVSCNTICGEYEYIAMRTRNVDEVKHSGNVETYGAYSSDRERIEEIVDALNYGEENQR